jgi:5-formyltetrahydrofolate cyclo-ligase
VSSTAERKAELRSRLRAVRKAIPADERLTLGGAVQDRLMATATYQEARTVLLFYSFGSEIPTAGVIQRSLDSGKRVFLPLLESGRMLAAELRPGDSLAATAYGPKEPSNRVPIDPDEIGLVVAPGLGFDREGYRLGYGGGHYDRYLASLPASAPRIGIAFHQQLMEELPHDAGDERLDLVVTDMEVVVCPARPGGPPVDAASTDPAPEWRPWPSPVPPPAAPWPPPAWSR